MVLLDNNLPSSSYNKSLYEASLAIQTAYPYSSRSNFWNHNSSCHINSTSFPRLRILLGSLAQCSWDVVYGTLLIACNRWNFCLDNEESCKYGLEDLRTIKISFDS